MRISMINPNTMANLFQIASLWLPQHSLCEQSQKQSFSHLLCLLLCFPLPALTRTIQSPSHSNHSFLALQVRTLKNLGEYLKVKLCILKNCCSCFLTKRWHSSTMKKREIFLARIKISETINFSSFKTIGWGNSTKIPEDAIQDHFKKSQG